VRPITINVTEKIEISEDEGMWGVTKLRNKIYVLFHAFTPCRIRVFEDRHPFRLQTDNKAEEIKDPIDIGSSEKENCLYVSDGEEKCVWKITRETDDQFKIIKWLTTDYLPYSMSVSRDGESLMINDSLHRLMIYGSDAELIRSIPLTKAIKYLRHAVETSIGNFIIIHKHEDKEEEEPVVMGKGKHIPTDRLESIQGKVGSNRRKREWLGVVSELTRDGQMVIRRFIPSNETQQLIDCCYLSIDSDDRVFVADAGNDEVILLDSDFKWNRIVCPKTEERKEQILKGPWRLFYDEEMKQLIVKGYFPYHAVNVYTLIRN